MLKILNHLPEVGDVVYLTSEAKKYFKTNEPDIFELLNEKENEHVKRKVKEVMPFDDIYYVTFPINYKTSIKIAIKINGLLINCNNSIYVFQYYYEEDKNCCSKCGAELNKSKIFLDEYPFCPNRCDFK
jgi:hypothetical protein